MRYSSHTSSSSSKSGQPAPAVGAGGCVVITVDLFVFKEEELLDLRLSVPATVIENIVVGVAGNTEPLKLCSLLGVLNLAH